MLLLGGSGGVLPQEIRPYEIESESISLRLKIMYIYIPPLLILDQS